MASTISLSSSSAAPAAGSSTGLASESSALAGGATGRISFICQRCLQPLRMDKSFDSLNEHAIAELKLPLCPPPDIDLQSQSGSLLDKFVPPFDASAHNHGFTLVGGGDSTQSAAAAAALSTKLKATAELFDIISNNSDVDHPLCEECTDTLLETMDQQLKLAEGEAQDYQAYLQKLDSETEDGSRVEQLQKELESLELEETHLHGELSQLKDGLGRAEAELAEQVEEREKLEKDEQKYWREYSKYKRELLLAEDDYRSLDCQLHYTQSQLEKLKKTNVFNATFHIWHTGHFATINGFRLGRLPSVPVEWSEINAAWGQTALLLSSLANKIGLKEFEKYKLVPYGSFSYIKVESEDGRQLPLHGSGGFRMIWDTKFDAGMVAFLDCLQQFAQEVSKQGGGFALPYEIEKGKIRDSNTGQQYSIKIQFNSEDNWTKACRYTLTNLKWGVAFVSTKYMKQATDINKYYNDL